MYAKKFFSFSSKPFSYFTSSFSNFFSSLNIFTTESPEAEYTDNDQSSQNKDFNFYQIQTQSCQEFINSYEDWNGKKNFSHNMTERLPCKMILKGNSFLGNVLSFFSQVYYYFL